MYISRLALNASTPSVLRLISSPYRVHAAIERSFLEGAARQSDEGRILWRLDSVSNEAQVDDGNTTWLYVVSPEKPNLGVIASQCNLAPTVVGESKDYSPVLDSLSDGQVWQFRLKANPARKVSHDYGKVSNERVVGTVQGHVTAKQQLDWLLDRCEKHGFAVLHDPAGYPIVRVSQRHREEFERGGSTVTISTAVYDGILRVTDADLLRRTLGFGLGRAKGFGCGLLTIAPAQ